MARFKNHPHSLPVALLASLLMVLSLLVACDRQSSIPKIETPDLRAWTAALPEKEAPAQGSLVWAAVPRADGTVRLGSYTVSAVEASERVAAAVTLVDDLGIRYSQVPSALIRLRNETAPDPGAPVLAELPSGVLVLGRSLDASHVRLVANGEVFESKAVAQEAYDASVENFRSVFYADAVGWQRAFVLASSDQQIWLHTPDGRVEKRSREEVRELEIVASAVAEIKVGDVVWAGSWARGFEEGSIVDVVAPGLAFRVETASGRSIRGFDSLVLPPAPWQVAD